MSHQSLSPAVVYTAMSDDKSTQTRRTTSTTSSSSADERLYMPALSSFKTCSLVLGLLVGFFIYLSTLGAEFVGVMLWGREILNKSNHELILFSLMWNFITTMIAIVILSSMRRLVTIVFMASVSKERQNAEDVLCELLSYMEGRFAVGALVGICTSWNVTNVVLGMRPQIIQSCVILAVACLWCRVTLVLLGSPEQALIHDDEEEEEEEQDQISTPLLNV
ncbi:expressed unknown protein [Seminavis robusta]|uniref:Transmembrane protein n=1 Tax=Seminavis robusta TaxID=568900 RepID=A0A9N8HNL4_9STRA|nr:expressed unknown protein [Seminavis robusta]|eukprot:Sro996_g229280.1 n/a (221) ;mRNA; r:18323-18985